MLMVIIGAGASYDSSSDQLPPRSSAKRPPLADDLFHERYLRFRGSLPLSGILPELVPKNGRSIEAVLQRIQQQSGANPMRSQQLAAVRFYLKDLLTDIPDQWIGQFGGSNFNALVDQIQNGRRHSGKTSEPVCLVTFNYDSLLEKALAQECGIEFDSLSAYTSHSEFKLFKLHGSVNWGRIVTSAPGRPSWSTADVIREVDRLSISDRFSLYGQYTGKVPLYPAIAIPVTEKAAFECPSEHLALLGSLIPKVTKILAIGWRGTENHFLALLRGHGAASIVAIAGSETEANDTINRMRTVGVSITSQTSLAGFSDAVGDGKLYDFFEK